MDILNFEYIKQLEHGSNKQQIATLNKTHDIVDYECEFELTYNDILGMTTAVKIAAEFYDVKGAVLTKNTQVTGVALGTDLSEALVKAVDCNPVDSLSGVVAFTNTVDKKTAMQLGAGHLVVAPNFDDDAIKIFNKNSVRYVKLNTELNKIKNFITEEIVITPFGTIVQDVNDIELNKDNFKVVTKTKPTVEQIEDAIFAWKVAKYVKSNGIIAVKNFKTLAIAQGLQSQAMEFAMNYACDTAKESIVASDLPITITDFNAALQNRVSMFILPGVTQDIIKLADKYDKTIITTGFATMLT
ncbi:MAG: hypothetical protein ACI4S3_05425 [Candidatus Gastranaerophilaceae bacterium]